MGKKEPIDFKIELPTNDKLNFPRVENPPPLYSCEFSPSAQVYSFQIQFLNQEATSIGPMYVQA